MIRKQFSILLVFCLLLSPSTLLAHGGGLNSEGCHTNRKTGDYHCHRSSYSPPPRRTAPPPPPPTRRVRERPVQAPSRLLGGTSSIRVERAPSAINKTEMVATAQVLLTVLGYAPGSTDGTMTVPTRSAILRFQSHHELEVDGEPSGGLLVSLSKAVLRATEGLKV